MDCTSAYANAPCPPPPPHFPPGHLLPFTGGTLELIALVGFAVAAIALGLLVRYSERGA
jgi:hypothetical protein